MQERNDPHDQQHGEHSHHRGRVFRSVGLGLITGASDDDPSAIGTYASAGAKFGPSFLWTAPAMFPMMFVVVYLSSKLGQVSGRGLFEVIHDCYPRWVLHLALVGVLIGNTCEAAADIGGMAAALNVLIPISIKWLVAPITAAILALQIWGSYTLIRNIFRWLALALLAYAGSAVLARPDIGEVVRGTLLPHVTFNRDALSFLVAMIGTSLSAYLYTWQSNVEVEEEIEKGRIHLSQRQGASEAELHKSRVDILWGIFFASVVMYFIILSTTALFKTGKTEISTAADAAQALVPLAGKAAGLLFAIGVVAVGFLAVPVMTTGAAYDLCQTAGWEHGLHKKPSEAKAFYLTIAAISVVAMSLNFIGVNPIKALVWAGIVQGFSTPPLMLLMLLMTNRRDIMGERVNGRAVNVLGWLTTIAIFAASAGLIVSWIV
jgi:Mn2+/Fe2+ NRAMP family transporter